MFLFESLCLHVENEELLFIHGTEACFFMILFRFRRFLPSTSSFFSKKLPAEILLVGTYSFEKYLFNGLFVSRDGREFFWDLRKGSYRFAGA